MEFDETASSSARSEKVFTRTHGLRIDKDGNIWATDVRRPHRR